MAGAAVAGGALAGENRRRRRQRLPGGQQGRRADWRGNQEHRRCGARQRRPRGRQRLPGSSASKPAIDDDAIQSSENMMLTFKNVRNEAGKGNKIFDKATTSIVDLVDRARPPILSRPRSRLGKALNDPIAKVTDAHSRKLGGIQFDQGAERPHQGPRQAGQDDGRAEDHPQGAQFGVRGVREGAGHQHRPDARRGRQPAGEHRRQARPDGREGHRLAD
jgi:hypothetical protein